MIKEQLKEWILSRTEEEYVAFSNLWRWSFDVIESEEESKANHTLLTECLQELVEEKKLMCVDIKGHIDVCFTSGSITAEGAIGPSKRKYYISAKSAASTTGKLFEKFRI